VADYTLYWHLRHRPRWQGKRLAWAGRGRLAAVLFAFLGMDWLRSWGKD